MDPPEEWPTEIRELYDPIRILGKGGFASVVLARAKTVNSDNKKNKVAIKVVGGIQEAGIHLSAAEIKEQRDRAVLYARREIEILNHVQHHNIVRLYHHWMSESEDDNESETKNGQKEDLTAAVLVLEYAKGPTVESLLKHGGALSTNFGRIVIAQTIDAIAYLHSRAVLHRDIKPDNILVTGALSSDASIWDNEEKNCDYSLDGGHRSSEPNWEALRSKYKVTLIDFGFARALTPNDVAKPSRETVRKDSELASYHRISYDSSYKDTPGGGTGGELGTSQRSTTSGSLRRRISRGILDSSIHRMLGTSNSSRGDELSKSVSHRMKRTMSALGNKMFAAPEIVNQVRSEFRPRIDPVLQEGGESTTIETISNYVADYGLLVDSYSMGHTIRYMMTGVQPGISVEDAILQQNGGAIGKLFSLCCAKKSDGDKQKRSVHYRNIDDLPGEILRLVGTLTQISEKNRLSIRKARWNVPWIADALQSQEDEKKEQAQFSPQINEISHLPFAIGTTEKPINVRKSPVTLTTVLDTSGKTVDLSPIDST